MVRGDARAASCVALANRRPAMPKRDHWMPLHHQAERICSPISGWRTAPSKLSSLSRDGAVATSPLRIVPAPVSPSTTSARTVIALRRYADHKYSVTRDKRDTEVSGPPHITDVLHRRCEHGDRDDGNPRLLHTSSCIGSHTRRSRKNHPSRPRD